MIPTFYKIISLSNIYRIIEAKKIFEFDIFKIYIKSIENVQKIIQDQGLDLNVVDLESNDNPNNYIIFSSDQKEFKDQFDKVLKELSKTYLGGSYLPDKSQLQ